MAFTFKSINIIRGKLIYGLTYLFLFIISSPAPGTNQKTDSLLIQLKNVEKMVRPEKAKLYKNLASTYYFDHREYDSALYYGKRSLQIYNALKSYPDVAYVYKIMGYAKVDGENYKEGIIYLDSALHYYKDMDVLLPVIQVYTNKGIACNYIDKPEKALLNFQKAVDYSIQLGDSNQIAINTLNTGIMYNSMGQYPKAAEYLTKAAEIFEFIGDSVTAVNTFIEIGDVYLNWEKYDVALEYYRKASKLKENVKNEKVLVSLYDAMGYAYQQKDSMVLAKDYFKKALDLSRKIDYKSGKAQIYYRLGNLAKLEHNYYLAVDHFRNSLNIEKEIGSVQDIVALGNELSECYLGMGMYKESRKELMKVNKKCKEYQFRKQLSTNYFLLYKLYKKLENSNKALGYYEKHITLKDSIYGEKQELLMEDLRKKYETEKKERTIDKLNTEKHLQSLKISRQNQLVIALVIGFILIFLVVFLLYIQWKRKEENRRLIIQQQLFRSQMNPHFIFNALNAIKNYVTKNKGPEAVDYLVDFSCLMRLILEGSSDDFTTLQQETELLKSYLNLQQLRFNQSFEYTIKTDDSIDPEEIVFPSMLLQPFVENAVEHGMKKGGSKIDIIFRQGKNKIEATIMDDGPGFHNRKTKTGTHKPKALQITQERLRLLKKMYKWEIKYTLRAVAEEFKTGTIVVFEVPYKTNKKNLL